MHLSKSCEGCDELLLDEPNDMSTIQVEPIDGSLTASAGMLIIF